MAGVQEKRGELREESELPEDLSQIFIFLIRNIIVNYLIRHKIDTNDS